MESPTSELPRCGEIVEWSLAPYERRFGRFPRKRGEGATKTVYEACDLKEGKLVAWSEISTSSLTPEERARVNAEVALLEQVKCDQIVEYLATWATDDKVVLITALVESGDLLHFVRSHNVKLKVIKKWCRQIISGIKYLHSFYPPIIHRDLKCENVLYNATDGTLRLTDFGLSTRELEQGTCAVLGTPAYMAPELFEGSYSETVDVYSYGMCVLEMVTRRMPYDECGNPAQLYRKVSSGVLPDAFQLIRSEAVKAFIRFCLERLPDGRRPSAAEVEAHPFLDEGAPLPEDDEDDLLIQGGGGSTSAREGRRRVAELTGVVGEPQIGSPPSDAAGMLPAASRAGIDGGSGGEGSGTDASSAPAASGSGAEGSAVAGSSPSAASAAQLPGDGLDGHALPLPEGSGVPGLPSRGSSFSSRRSDNDSGAGGGSGAEDMAGWEAAPDAEFPGEVRVSPRGTEWEAGPRKEERRGRRRSLSGGDVAAFGASGGGGGGGGPIDAPIPPHELSPARLVSAPILVDLSALYDPPAQATHLSGGTAVCGGQESSAAPGTSATLLPLRPDSALRESPPAGSTARPARASVASVRLQFSSRGSDAASPQHVAYSSREFASVVPPGPGVSHGSLQSMRGATHRSHTHGSPPSAAMQHAAAAAAATAAAAVPSAATFPGVSGSPPPMLFLCLEILHIQDDGEGAQATLTFGFDIASNAYDCAAEIVRSLRDLSLRCDDATCTPMIAAFLIAQRAAPLVTITTGPIARYNWQSLILRQVPPETQGDAGVSSSVVDATSTASTPLASSSPALAPASAANSPVFQALSSALSSGQLLGHAASDLDAVPDLSLDGGPPGGDSTGGAGGRRLSAAEAPHEPTQSAFAINTDMADGLVDGGGEDGVYYPAGAEGLVDESGLVDDAASAAGLVDDAAVDADFIASLGETRRRRRPSHPGSVGGSGGGFSGEDSSGVGAGRRVSSTSQLSLVDSVPRAGGSQTSIVSAPRHHSALHRRTDDGVGYAAESAAPSHGVVTEDDGVTHGYDAAAMPPPAVDLEREHQVEPPYLDDDLAVASGFHSHDDAAESMPPGRGGHTYATGGLGHGRSPVPAFDLVQGTSFGSSVTGGEVGGASQYHASSFGAEGDARLEGGEEDGLVVDGQQFGGADLDADFGYAYAYTARDPAAGLPLAAAAAEDFALLPEDSLGPALGDPPMGGLFPSARALDATAGDGGSGEPWVDTHHIPASALVTGRGFSGEADGPYFADRPQHGGGSFSEGDAGGGGEEDGLMSPPPAPPSGPSSAPTPARIAGVLQAHGHEASGDGGGVVVPAGDGGRRGDGGAGGSDGSFLLSPGMTAPAEDVLFSPVLAGTVSRGAASLVS